MNCSVKYGSRSIPYVMNVSNRKRLRIIVKPDLSVHANAPQEFTGDEIMEAVQSKAKWIARQIDAFRDYHPYPTPHQYISGETFVYLGRQYRLKVIEGPMVPAKLRGKFLNLAVENKEDREAIKKSLDSWYRSRADEVFNKYLSVSLKVAKRHGVKTKPKLMIRDMRTRWGSCSNSGRVTLNLKLIQAPVHCIEYVIMHELCHLVHLNHSSEFYNLLNVCMPDWKKRKKILKRVTFPLNENLPKT